MPPLSGSGKHHYGGVRQEDYGGGESVQRTAAGSSSVQGMQRAVGGRIPVESSDDSTWESGGATMPGYHPGQGQVPPGIPDVLSSTGGTADIPRGGVPRKHGNEDGDAGALRAPACPRHRGDAGERKLPPPTVHLVQHAGPPAGVDRASPGDRAVC